MCADARPELMGQDQTVPLVTGEWRRYVNLDYAASTPPLLEVVRDVEALLPWYSSVHRGAGFKSQVSSAAYESARTAVGTFFGARDGDTVIFTRNTTDALNLLATQLPEDTQVLTFAVEHHANLLPWRRSAHVRYLPIPESPDAALDTLESALRALPAGSPRLVAVTGASNVTGEVWPLKRIVDLAHRYDARLLVDAAQLAPHFPLNLQEVDADYITISGHKMYAPFGVGALIGRADWLHAAPPFLFGGGAVDFVTLENVMWAPLPARQEAGSPNVVGAVALGAACNVLHAYGMARLAREEMELAAYMRDRLAQVPGIELYALWNDPCVPRLGIVSFNLSGVHHSRLAAILSAEFGVAVRHGCFCAHPYIQHLLRCSPERQAGIGREIAAGRRGDIPGAVRISVGLGTTREEIDYAAEAMEEIVRHGARWHYRLAEQSGDYLPDPDPRTYPDLSLDLDVLLQSRSV